MSLNCRVFRDEKGQIDFVNAPNGNRSKLFDTLVNITGGNKNTALNIYALTETEDLKDAVKAKVNSFKERFKNIVKIAPNYSNMNAPIEEIRFSKTANTSGYFSNALSAISNLSDKNPKNTQGWIKQLTDVQKNGGIKNVNQELQWIGLEDYLNDYVKENNPKAGNIPASVVEEYIKSNQIEIVDVSKGVSPSEKEMEDAGFTISEGGFGEVILKIEGRGVTSENDERLNNYQKDLLKRYFGASPTKYLGYQLKGGENYREVLLTMPPKKKVSDKINKVLETATSEKDVADQLFNDFIYPQKALDLGYIQGDGDIANMSLALAMSDRDSYERLTLEDRLKYVTEEKFEEAKLLGEKAVSLYESSKNKEITLEGLAYKSSHWDEVNILAHVRLNEKTLPDGRRVLIVNEIQSDWAQEGRKVGFINKELQRKSNISSTKYKALQEELVAIKEAKKANKDAYQKILYNDGKGYTTNVDEYGNVTIAKSVNDFGKQLGDSTGVEAVKEGEGNYRIYVDGQVLGENSYYGSKEVAERTIEERKNRVDFRRSLKETVEIESLPSVEQEGFRVIQDYYSKVTPLERQIAAVKRDIIEQSGIQSMPYTNTDQWVGLVTRRVIQMAAQEGYDGVAFATGQQSADMYSLAKQVDNISWDTSDNTLTAFDKNGNQQFQQSNVTDEKLENFVGKEVAEKLIKRKENLTEEDEGVVNLENADLEVGGEGMKTFYDKIVPKVVQKEAQRFDKNAKLETIDFSDNFTFSKKELDDYTNYLLNKYNLDKTGRHRVLIEKNATAEELDKYKNLLDNFRKDNDSKTSQGDKLSLGVQPYIVITDKMRSELQGAIPLFSKNQGEQAPKEVVQQITDRLKQSGLAKNVYQMSNSEIEAKLVELGVSPEVAKQVIAYHGSPYSFDKFTTDKMGTGEGAQAFGWGLYFTDLESIARSYAENLGGLDAKIYANGKEIGYGHSLFDYQQFLIRANGDVDSVLSELKEIQKLESGFPKNARTKAREKAISFLEKSPKIKIDANKRLYKVSLNKGKTPSEYTWLEWDKPVSKEVIKTLSEKDKQIADVLDMWINDGIIPASVNDKVLDGANLYRYLSGYFGGQKEASLFLLENGIDGIKYPAESISRGATSDNARGFNYVVFDENAITIEEQLQFSKKGIDLNTAGFTYKGDVYLNTDVMGLDTPIHEFGHLHLDWLKENRTDLYQAGLSLIEKNKEEAQQYINTVKETQPDLKEGTEKFNNEVLAQVIGDQGARLVNSKKDNSIADWLKNVWEAIRDILGLSNYTAEQVANMTLAEFGTASAAEMLSGKVIKDGLDFSTFLPNKVISGVNEELVNLSEQYKKENNLPLELPRLVISLSEKDAMRVADAYDEMKHDPNNPKVQSAYNSLITEIKKQADLLLNAGYKFELSTKERGYNSSSEMIKDVKDNKHIFIDPSSENFGTTREFNEDNIGLADSGYKDINGNPLTNVEVIRAVHDVFGHAKFGTQFGAIGEENAWRVHMSMFSPEAQKALTATTRGQNSWVNFGGHMRKNGKILKKGDEGYMSPTERPFAEQKIGLLPEWTTDNSYGDVVTINGKTIIPVNKYSVLGEDIYEIADGKAYYDAILSAKNSRLGTEIPEDVRDGIQVYVKSEEDYQNIIDKGGKLLVSKDGLTGVMVEADGNIGSGFNHSSNTKPNSLAPYLVAGIKMGARYTDAYDTYLPKYYAKFGFVASERMKFNEEYAEDGWDKSILKTKPDVVFMYFDGGDRMTIEDRVGTFEPYKKTDGQYIEDYDQGVENAKNKTSKEASLLPLVSKDLTSDVSYSMISDGERKLYEDEVKRKEGFALSQNTNWARDEWFKMLVYSDNKTIMKMTEKAAPTLLIKVAEQYNLPLKGSNLKLAAMSAVRKEASRQNREMFGVDFSKTTKNPLSISPENSSNYANLTEDGQGNFVFYHVGNSGYETIKRSSGSTLATSKQEAQALSKVGGLAMYYTRPEDGETMVNGNSKYMVKVPMNKVYDFNTDSLGLTQKAKELHSKEHPGKSFDANTQVAYVTKLAGELGYEMVVAEWANRTRAQSIKELIPIDTQVSEGSVIKKSFKENYDSNSTKGFKSVIPIPKDEQLKQLYLDLNNYRNRENKYDNIYRLYEENTKLSQEEITDRIKNSDLPQEYKSKYESILNTPEERRRSNYPISKSVKRVPSLELNGTRIFAKERVNPITGESMGDIEWELIESTERGQGNARKAAEMFLNGTDAQGKDVYLTISPRDAQTSPERLESFYSSLGFKKVSDFEMIRKAKPITPKDIDSNGEVSVKALMDFSNSKVKPLGLEGLKAAKNAAMALKVKSSDELIEKMEKALMKNGIVLFDKLSLQRSKLYNTFEINTILSSPSLQKQIKESLLSLKNSEPFQIDYNENFIVPQGREVNQFGKQEVLNPSTVEKDLIESVAGLSEDEIDEALPAAFSNRYYTDSDFRETVDSIARDYKKAPVKEIVEGELVDKTEDVKGMLTNTLTDDFNESIAEDIRFLREEIDEDIFNSNLTKVSKILNKIKKNAYINGIDLRNFPTLALELSRSEILGFLDSMEDMLSEPYNQDAFDEFSDRYFEILGEKEPKTEVIKSNSQNDVFVDEPLSEYEMFSKFGLVKKQDNIYRKVTDAPLETLYENFFEHKNLLPEGVDSIDNLKVYVQKNTGALEVSDYEVDVDNLEKMFLYKKFFGFPMSTVKPKVSTEGFNRLTNSEEYLTEDFVKEFNKWILATENPYFKVTSKGIELTQKDDLSKSEAVDSVPVRFKQDLAEYNIISNNLNLDLPLEEEQYRDINTQYEERQNVVNNPDRVKKVAGQYTYLKDGVLAVKNEGATFVRTPIGVFEKIFEFANIKFYGKLDTDTNKGYKKVVAEAPFSDINFNDYMYLENTPEAFKDSKNYYSRKELDDINKDYFECQ